MFKKTKGGFGLGPDGNKGSVRFDLSAAIAAISSFGFGNGFGGLSSMPVPAPKTRYISSRNVLHIHKHHKVAHVKEVRIDRVEEIFPGRTYYGQGKRECARRVRQLQRIDQKKTASEGRLV